MPGIILPKHVRKRGGNNDTADELWRAYIHGLNAAYMGVHAERDHLGNKWPPGCRRDLAAKPLCEGRVRAVVLL